MNTNKGKGVWIALIAALAVIVVVAIVVVLSANSPAKKYQKQLELAERYLEDLDYDQAIAAYRAAIAIDPKNPEAYEALAELYIDQGEDEKALEILNAGVEETQAEELKKLASETETRIAEAEAAKEITADNSGDGENAAGQGEDGNGTDSGNTEPNDGESAEPVVPDGEYYENDEGYIVFGRYEQDGDESNGPEPIEWEVLEDNDDSMLLISRYILDAQPYNTVNVDVTWESCSLRKWLNDDFFSTAFTSEEQGRIQTVNLSNPDNAFWEIEGGNDTTDKLFCLSVEEIINHYSFRSWNDYQKIGYCQGLMTEATQYAENKGALTFWITQNEYDNYLAEEGYDESCIDRMCVWWWLRSPGKNGNYAGDVGNDGFVGWCVYWDVDDTTRGVRPALYIEQ